MFKNNLDSLSIREVFSLNQLKALDIKSKLCTSFKTLDLYELYVIDNDKYFIKIKVNSFK